MKKLTKILLSCLLSLTCIHQVAFNEVNATENRLGNIDTRSAGIPTDEFIIGDFEYRVIEYSEDTYLKEVTITNYNGFDTEITIPEKLGQREINGVVSAGFSKADNLEKIHVSPDNKYYSSVDGILYNKDKTALIKIPNGYKGSKFIIPESVTNINEFAFTGCKNINSIEVSKNNPYYSSIDGVLFNKNGTRLIKVPCNYSKKDYTVPNTVEEISVTAFDYCDQLTDITISENVVKIEKTFDRDVQGTDAFSKCKNLKNINVSEKNTVYSSTDGVLFDKEKHLLIKLPCGYEDETYILPEEVYSTGKQAFAGCNNLKYFTFPKERWIRLGAEQFINCTNLEEVNVLPNFNIYLYPGDFIGCTKLKKINISEDNENYCSENGVVYSKDKKELMIIPSGYSERTYTIPEGVETIKISIFEGFSNLEEINIPDSLTSIATWTQFDSRGSNLKAINVSENNHNFSSLNGILYNKDKTKLILAPSSLEVKEVVIPESVARIESNAFKNCSKLEKVVIPEGVTVIDQYLFENCINLKDINIPESVEKIDYKAFASCTSLKKITVPKNVTLLARAAFIGADCVLYVQPDSEALQHAIDYNIPYEIIRDINSISLDNKSLTMNVNDSKKLVASIDPTYSGFEKDLIWTTSNANVATVDENGVVTAHASGNANITVSTVNGLSATCAINVSQNLVKRGWVFENDSWYFYENGVKKTGWLMDSNTWYLLSNTGEMLTGWQSVNGTWYYMDENGKMQTGWLHNGGNWYLLSDSGKMLTDWQLVNGTWYYMCDNGIMETGWLYYGGNWYLLSNSGKMLTGWQLVSGTWYYMDESGKMQTGWLYNGGNWYLLSDSGKMLTDWQLVNGTWYYMCDNGIMETGWLYYGGNWYLLSDSGKMLTGWQLTGGAWYYLDSNGVWVE